MDQTGPVTVRQSQVTKLKSFKFACRLIQVQIIESLDSVLDMAQGHFFNSTKSEIGQNIIMTHTMMREYRLVNKNGL